MYAYGNVPCVEVLDVSMCLYEIDCNVTECLTPSNFIHFEIMTNIIRFVFFFLQSTIICRQILLIATDSDFVVDFNDNKNGLLSTKAIKTAYHS